MWINIKDRVVNFDLVKYYDYIHTDLYLYFNDNESIKFGQIEMEDFERIGRLLKSNKVGGWK